MATLLAPTWLLADSGRNSGTANMAVDCQSLLSPKPTLRFFQWDKPTVSYGYLMSVENGIKRPTGGGIVYHETTDLSLSIVWPRGQNILPEKPRDCYETIHKRLKHALETWSGKTFNLFTTNDCRFTETVNRKSKIGICFEEPVCNDIMLDGKKLVGGALRITRGAILYQGNILLENAAKLDELKATVAHEFI